MNKHFLIELKNGKREWFVIRQMAHDPQYAVGSKIPGLGRVVSVDHGEPEVIAAIAAAFGPEAR